MLDPTSGPFLFDTSAEGWFARQKTQPAREWMFRYLERFPVHVSAITVFERARLEYLADPRFVWTVDQGVASTAAGIFALLRQPPTPPRRAHQFVESRQERLARWRAGTMIAAKALAADLLLIHNNAADFAAIRGSIERDPDRFP